MPTHYHGQRRQLLTPFISIIIMFLSQRAHTHACPQLYVYILLWTATATPLRVHIVCPLPSDRLVVSQTSTIYAVFLCLCVYICSPLALTLTFDSFRKSSIAIRLRKSRYPQLILGVLRFCFNLFLLLLDLGARIYWSPGRHRMLALTYCILENRVNTQYHKCITPTLFPFAYLTHFQLDTHTNTHIHTKVPAQSAVPLAAFFVFSTVSSVLLHQLWKSVESTVINKQLSRDCLPRDSAHVLSPILVPLMIFFLLVSF